MDKKASPGADNSVTRLPIPFIGDINNRRFVTAVLSGIIGGAGVSAAANLLRSYRDMRKKEDDDTNDETIVLTLPKKAAECSGYDGMRSAKPGESKVTTNGGRQFRDSGRFGKSTGVKKEEPDSVKCAEGNPGYNSVGTVVANTLGLTAGGIMAYDVVSRLFDEMNERRLKRKLRAAQQAYVNALSGESKRAEAVLKVLNPVEHVIMKEPLEKCAIAGPVGWLSDVLPDTVTNAVRYPTAAYILALLAGTGATAYVTKKVMDREFPEEKLKKDINKPTRIVFKTAEGRPVLLEGEPGNEKTASAETCAAITAMLPIYMDVVEGKPNRTLAEPYVKIAAAAGTDPEGLMKMAQMDMSEVYRSIWKDPKAIWEIVKGTGYLTNFSKQRAVDVLRKTRPDTYRQAVDRAIDARFADRPDAGVLSRAWNGVRRGAAKGFAALGGRDYLVDRAMKSAGVSDLVSTESVLGALKDDDPEQDGVRDGIDEKAVLAAVRKRLKGRRSVSVEAGDPDAAAYLRNNGAAVRRLLKRLNAQGAI